MTWGTLDADGLHDSGTQSRLGRQQLMETPHALHAGIVAADIDHSPVAYDVVGDDGAAGPAEPQRPGQVLRIGWPVGVDEDDIEGARLTASSCGRVSQRGSTRTSTMPASPARARLSRATLAKELGGPGLVRSWAPGQHVSCGCLLYTSPSPRDRTRSRMPSSA